MLNQSSADLGIVDESTFQAPGISYLLIDTSPKIRGSGVMSYGRQLKTEVSEAPGPVPRPALHLSFLLLSGFAAVYFRDHPSALRAAGLSGARCGGFGDADARLITIGELDASCLECTL